ncbi:S1C family serine protease [Aquibacillus sediminis]|uniref:S1C family serine protease n=1 Tax=Aquibacillus sediminis TaxID=2574734 RepID=UPI0011080943|nr:trypsin-like peptidase domain-containing protein [Aquibacillus sediminis]
MGYYDGHHKPPKKNSWVYSTVLGVVIGACLFMFALPTLSDLNLLPYNVNSQDQEIANQSTDRDVDFNNNLQNLNVNITTQITDVVEKVAPSVVGVVNIQSQSDLWEQADSEAGTGSGVIYKVEDGRAFVVSNHHVIQGADQIEVVLSDETRVDAELKGSDLFTDLAVLEMDSTYVDHVIDIGHSENIRVGEPAIAIGSPLGLHLSGSVTQGIISGKQRAIPQDFDQDGRADWQAEVIQTDAAINPGNSGGALINMSGQLIGINSMKIAQDAVEGIGFAIPIDDALPVINQLETKGQMTRAYLGVEAYSLEDISQVEWRQSLQLPRDIEEGIYVRSIEPGSPAAEANLEPYDVITHLDGEKMNNIVDLRKHLYQVKQVGEDMVITFYREGSKQEVTVNLASQQY